MSGNNKYSLEFKESSAKLAYESELSVAQTARNLGISDSTLHGWIHQFHNKKEEVALSKEQQKLQIKRLEKELKQVKIERDILKKAAAYFAQVAL